MDAIFTFQKENWEMKKRLMIVRSLASTLSNISILKSLLDVDLVCFKEYFLCILFYIYQI